VFCNLLKKISKFFSCNKIEALSSREIETGGPETLGCQSIIFFENFYQNKIPGNKQIAWKNPRISSENLKIF